MTDDFHAPTLAEFGIDPVLAQIAVVGGGVAVVAAVIIALTALVRRSRH